MNATVRPCSTHFALCPAALLDSNSADGDFRELGIGGSVETYVVNVAFISQNTFSNDFDEDITPAL